MDDNTNLEILNKKFPIIEANEDLIILGNNSNPGIVFVEVIDSYNLKTFNDVLVGNDVLYERILKANINKDNVKIYYTIKNTDNHSKVINLINKDNPVVIVLLGRNILTDIFKFKEVITNKCVNVPEFSRTIVIPTYSPRNENLSFLRVGCELARNCYNECKDEIEKLNNLDNIKLLKGRLNNSRNRLNLIEKTIKEPDVLDKMTPLDRDSINNTIDNLKLQIEKDSFALSEEEAKYIPNPNELYNKCNPQLEVPAKSTIIYSYNEFENFCNEYIITKNRVGYDVETNALPTMDVNHEIIGFSLGNDEFQGCYVPFKSIGFKMPEEDRQKIEQYLINNIFDRSNNDPKHFQLWVYNCQHEIPVVYNHYNKFLKNINDLYIWVKLLNCGKEWTPGSRTLKRQVFERCNFQDWSEDLDIYMSLFKNLNKVEKQEDMKRLLSKYYEEENELEDIMNKVLETYEDIKDTLSANKVMSYEYVPCKLIGKYGSLDSSSLFILRRSFDNDIQTWRNRFNIELEKGFDLWQKVHIAHIMMEMNGLYFNDKKAEKLNIWIDEQVKDIMDQIVNSPLSREWIKRTYYYEFSRNVLMMNYIDELVGNFAKVVQGRNGITKDCIKFHDMTPTFIRIIRGLNDYAKYFNYLLEIEGFSFQNLKDFEELGVNDVNSIEIYQYLNMVTCGKPIPKIEIEYSKGEFVAKINWQAFLLLYYVSYYNETPTLLDDEFNKWFEEKLKNLKTFEDYKELFNVNSTVKPFREYMSDILLSDDIKKAHTYYKLYEFTESATFDEDKEKLKSRNPKYGNPYYEFIEDYEDMMINTKDEEVFSPKRLEVFKSLFNKYVDDKFLEGLKYKRKLAECFDWYLKENLNVDSKKSIINKYYKLSTLDSGMIEHLTLLYTMLNCDIDKRETWTDEFKFMFNYKFIKKLLKAKSTYIDGATGRSVAYYVDKKYYLNEMFPRRLSSYKTGEDTNRIYDHNKAIEVELENDTTLAFPLDEEVYLIDGSTKLAKDLLPEDDIDISKYYSDFELSDEDIEQDDLDDTDE